MSLLAPGLLEWWQQLLNGDQRLRFCQWRDFLPRLQDRFPAVAEAEWLRLIFDWMPKDFNLRVSQIHNPVVRNPGTGIEAGFRAAVVCQSRIGDFDDKQCSGRMTGSIIVKRSPH